MLASLVLLMAASEQIAPNPTQRLTLHIAATTASEAVKQIAEKTGLELTVSGTPAHEVVLLRCRDVTAKEAMDRLAGVLHAEWSKTEKGFHLSRPQTLQRELEEKHRKSREKLIQKELDPIELQMRTLGTPVQRAEATIAGVNRELERERNGIMDLVNGTYEPRYPSPARYLLFDLLLALGADSLSRVPNLKPVVYSSDPTGIQLPLPEAARRAVDLYRQTEEKLAALTDARGPKGLSPYDAEAIFGAAHKDGGVGKVLLILGAGAGSRDQLWCAVRAYTREGKSRAQVVHRFWLSELTPNRNESGTVQESAILARSGGKKVPVTPLANAYHQACPGSPMEMDGYVKKIETPSPELVEAVVRPDTREPLSLLVGPAIEALSDENVVACIPDSLQAQARAVCKEGQLDVTAFRALLEAVANAQITEQGGWLEIKPKIPTLSERLRAPREAMASLAQDAYTHKAIRFRQECLYYEGVFGAYPSEVARTNRHILFALGVRSLHNFGPGPTITPMEYAMLGSLNESQWSALINGKELSLVDAPPRTREIAHIVLDSGIADRLPGFTEAQVPDIALQGAEAFKKSFDKQTILRLQTKQTPVIQNSNHTGQATTHWMETYPRTPLSAEDIAYQLLVSAQEDGVDPPTKLLAGRYWYGEQTRIGVQVLLPGRVFGSELHMNGVFADPPKPVAFDQLPDRFLRELASEIDKARKELAERSTTTPPPPPFLVIGR